MKSSLSDVVDRVFIFEIENIEVNADVSKMSLNERRIYERDQYSKLKENKASQLQSDGSLVCYAINSVWVSNWKNFLKYRNVDPPGPINNKNMQSYILQHRKDNKYTSDNNIEIFEIEDYYNFHFSMWRFLFEIYGGGPTIKIRYTKKQKTQLDYIARSITMSDGSVLRSQASLEDTSHIKKGRYFISISQETRVLNPNYDNMNQKQRRKQEND